MNKHSAMNKKTPSSFWQNTQHRKQDAVFLSKNANTNDEPEISDHFISHLQVSQISKIKSK